MTHNKTTVFVPAIEVRMTEPPEKRKISSQFRFLVRLAAACARRGVDYDVHWEVGKNRTTARFEATGAIPAATKISRPPHEKRAADWKPVIWDAEYQLDAYLLLGKWRPGFVIAHSCGLSLVKASESGELGVSESGSCEDIRHKWMVTHTASGREFGLTLNFARAARALLMAASSPVDWHAGIDAFKGIDFRCAGNEIIAKFGTKRQKQAAKRTLEKLAEA